MRTSGLIDWTFAASSLHTPGDVYPDKFFVKESLRRLEDKIDLILQELKYSRRTTLKSRHASIASSSSSDHQQDVRPDSRDAPNMSVSFKIENNASEMSSVNMSDASLDDTIRTSLRASFPRNERETSEGRSSEIRQSIKWGWGISRTTDVVDGNECNQIHNVSTDIHWPKSIQCRTIKIFKKANSGVTSNELKGAIRRSVSHRSRSQAQVNVPGSGSESSILSSETRYRFYRKLKCLWEGGCIIFPGSWQCTVLDCIGMVLLLYDAIVTPFVLAWSFEFDGLLLVLGCIIAFFWTLDMFFSSRRAYYFNGVLETRPMVIGTRYLKTRFAFDASLVACDYVGVYMGIFFLVRADSTEDQVAENSFVRLLRASRLIKLLGMARLGRVMQIMSRLFGEFEIGFALYETFKLLVGFCWLIHVMSCLWYSIHAPDAEDDTVIREYSSMVYCSLATMASGASPRSRASVEQTFFACVCIMLGLLFLGYFVSQLSSTATQLKAMRQEQESHISTLDRFLRQHNFRGEISSRALLNVKAYFDHKSKTLLKVRQVPALELLSEQMQSAISLELCRPHLNCHPLFVSWPLLDLKAVESISAQCIEFVSLLPNWDFFVVGTESTQAFLMISGKATYAQDCETARVEEECIEDIEVGVWICEAGLWAHWSHVGSAKSVSMCEVVSMNALTLIPILEQSHLLSLLVSEYAQQFHERLHRSVPPEAPWPTDLVVHGVQFPHLLSTSLSQNVRTMVGLAAIDEIKSKATSKYLFGVGSSHMRQLENELYEGKGVLYTVSQGRKLIAERGVSIVRVRVYSCDGLVLTNIGVKSNDDEVVTAKIDFPGCKQRYSEPLSDAAQRVLSELLFLPCVHLTHTETSSEIMASGSYRITTRYAITTYNYQLLPTPADEQISIPARCAESIYDPSWWEVQDRMEGAWSPLHESLAKHLASSEIYVSERNNGKTFHAWLSQEQVDFLKSLGRHADGFVDRFVKLALHRVAINRNSLASTGGNEPHRDTSSLGVEISNPSPEESIEMALADTDGIEEVPVAPPAQSLFWGPLGSRVPWHSPKKPLGFESDDGT